MLGFWKWVRGPGVWSSLPAEVLGNIVERLEMDDRCGLLSLAAAARRLRPACAAALSADGSPSA